MLSADEDNVEGALSFFKKMNLKDCSYTVVDAYDSIERKTVQSLEQNTQTGERKFNNR